MCIATSVNLVISADTMHHYFASLATLKTTLKTIMHMLSDKLDRGTREVYPDAMEARVHFQKDVTIEYTDTIVDY